MGSPGDAQQGRLLCVLLLKSWRFQARAAPPVCPVVGAACHPRAHSLRFDGTNGQGLNLPCTLCSYARPRPRRSDAGVGGCRRQLTGCQPAGWLIYSAPVAMELGGQLWAGVRASSFILSGDQQICLRLGGACSMATRPLAVQMAYPTQGAPDSDGGIASEVASKYSQFSQQCLQVGIAAVESV